DGLPAGGIDPSLDALAHPQDAGDDPAAVDDEVARRLLGVADLHLELGAGGAGAAPRSGQDAGIADLAAALAVEGRAVQDDLHRVARRGLVDQATVADDGQDLALAHRALALVAEEDGIAQSRSQLQVEVRDRLLARARKGGALALLLEEAAEGVLVDEEALLLGDDPGQVHRESVGVVELEDDVTR